MDYIIIGILILIVILLIVLIMRKNNNSELNDKLTRTEISVIKEISDFNKDYVKLDITDKKDNQSNWNVILSVLK